MSTVIMSCFYFRFDYQWGKKQFETVFSCPGDDISSCGLPKFIWICAMCNVPCMPRPVSGYLGSSVHRSTDNIYAC